MSSTKPETYKIKDSSYATTFIMTIQDEKWSPEPYLEYKSIRHISGQQEIGANTGKLHWQVFVQMTTSTMFSKMCKMFPKAHVEVCRDARNCYNYCKKDKTRVEDTYFTRGKPCFKRGQRTDLESCLDAAMDNGRLSVKDTDTYLRYHRGIERSLNLEPAPQRDIKVVYIWGQSGWGKTNLLRFPNACNITDNKGQWFHNYAGQKTIRINGYQGLLNPDTLRTLCSHDPTTLQVKGYSVPCLADTIIFTSNEPPTTYFHGPSWQRRLSEPWFLTIHVDGKTLEEVGASIDGHFATSPQLAPYEYVNIVRPRFE